jgi:hypothetical protein
VTEISDRARAAQAILAIPLFNEILNELETAEINQAVNTKYPDHEARFGHLAKVRAIRDLRARIEAISQEGQSTARKQAPA